MDSKINGPIHFNKQTSRPTSRHPFFEYKSDLNSKLALDKIKIKSGSTLIDFSKTLGRDYFQTSHNYQRNNYALNTKWDLIEPRNGKLVPDFSKSFGRKFYDAKPNCLNREFYDFKKLEMHISSPKYKVSDSIRLRSKSLCPKSNLNKK